MLERTPRTCTDSLRSVVTFPIPSTTMFFRSHTRHVHIMRATATAYEHPPIATPCRPLYIHTTLNNTQRCNPQLYYTRRESAPGGGAGLACPGLLSLPLVFPGVVGSLLFAGAGLLTLSLVTPAVPSLLFTGAGVMSLPVIRSRGPRKSSLHTSTAAPWSSSRVMVDSRLNGPGRVGGEGGGELGAERQRRGRGD